MGTNHSIPADYSTATYVILGVQTFLVTFAVAGRTISRRLMKAKTSVDDCLTHLAFISNLGLLISSLLLTVFGALRLENLSNWTVAERRSATDAFCALAVLYVLSVTFIKLSILFFYRRTFTMFETWFRWAWWATLNLVFLWAATCITLIAMQNTGTLPKAGFSRLGISITGIVNGFSDIVLMVLPAVMISKMRLPQKQKVAIMGIFMIGGVAAIVSIVRGAILFSNRRHKLTEAYSNYLDVVLTSTEASAGLMCACLPLTKPIVVRITRWIQRLRGLDTEHQGWTSNGTNQADAEKEKDRTILRVDDFHVQLLPAAESSHSQSSGSQSSGSPALDGRNAITPENPWERV